MIWAASLNESFAESAHKLVHSFMERWEANASILSSTKPYRVTSFEPTMDSALLLRHHSEEDGACDKRLIKHLEHLVTDIKDLSLLRK